MRASLNTAQVENIRKNGKRVQARYFTLYILENKEKDGIAAIVSKKIGNSVVRNKIKRRLREAYKELYDGKGNDRSAGRIGRQKSNAVIIYAKIAIIKAKYADIIKSLKTALG